jgi:peptide/nickel transport system permease protein
MSGTVPLPVAKPLPRGQTGVWRWLLGDTRAVVSLFWLAGLTALGLLAPLIAPYSPTAQSVDNMLQAPDLTHLLGTDDLGRDVFSRLLYGAPLALYASALATSVAVLVGVPTGLVAGFLGGWTDRAISRLIDTALSFPSILLAVGITGALGTGLTNGMIAIGFVFSPVLARLVRAQTLIVREELFIDASRCFGASSGQIIRRHIVPNVVQPVIVQVTLMLASSLLAEASLSFLGLGVQPPEPSWGAMLARAYSYMEVAPEQMYAPGLAILVTALAFNGFGESLRVALDPTLRRRR